MSPWAHRPRSIRGVFRWMQDAGEVAFPAVDPLSRERIRQSQFEQGSRAKALDALQRGDMTDISRNRSWRTKARSTPRAMPAKRGS